MEGKKSSESQIFFSQVMTAQDANLAGNVHGGVIMKHIDTAGGVAAARHATSNVVTASIDRLDFHNPTFIGNVLNIRASLNYVGTSSMEVGVRVEAEDLLTGERRHVASAYLTFVALGPDSKPMKVPALICATDEEKRRNREAVARRNVRLKEKQNEKVCQSNLEKCID